MSTQNKELNTCKNKDILTLGMISSFLVALLTIIFIISLPLTFHFSDWKDIHDYVSTFKPIHMFTVIPSILLASCFIIFAVSIHYYVDESKRVWSHLGIAFAVLYGTISTLNYLIQLITVIPSISSNQTDGLALFVAGYPNSIFYALMASYFFMCISCGFISFVFACKRLKLLFFGAFLPAPLCIITMVSNISLFMMIGAATWFLCLTIGCILLSYHFFCEIRNMS